MTLCKYFDPSNRGCCKQSCIREPHGMQTLRYDYVVLRVHKCLGLATDCTPTGKCTLPTGGWYAVNSTGNGNHMVCDHCGTIMSCYKFTGSGPRNKLYTYTKMYTTYWEVGKLRAAPGTGPTNHKEHGECSQ